MLSEEVLVAADVAGWAELLQVAFMHAGCRCGLVDLLNQVCALLALHGVPASVCLYDTVCCVCAPALSLRVGTL
jgi:hypothetical protein